ncbi:hypothetical protein BKA70DRAFT_1088947 [Coprinopsis sp. MPI-PUGE-AT-0042]|nr:hypothetical protein BKA70DRAFT_1088947 [Coprinopsis sp. MPI-PUGE-AT-0042]
MPPNATIPEAKSPKPHPLSNEAIEAAIQAATGSSHSSGSDLHSSMRKRSVASLGSGSGYASERSEHGEKDAGSGREGKANGSDSGRSHGPGGYGSGGDARSVPPRDTRTLLFVGNLPYRVRWQDLKDLFRRAGTVLRADVSLGPDNRSRGYGTVLLATAEDAGRAIDMLNGYEWQTRVLEVRVDRVGGVGHVVPSGPAPPLGMGQVVGGPMSMGMGQFEQMGLGSMGGMGVSGMGSMNPNVGYSGSGGMHQGQMGPGGMAGMSGVPGGGMHQLQQNLDLGGHFMSQNVGMLSQGQSMMSAASTPGMPGGPPGRTLFVGNLPYHVQWQDLKDLFRRVPSNHPIMQHHLQGGPQPIDPQGHPYPSIPPSLMTFNVLRADVALGPDGRSKGFGTVVFSNVEEADRARRVFSGYDFNGRQLKVHYDRMTTSGVSTISPAPTPSLTQQMMSLAAPAASPAGMRMHADSPFHELQNHPAPWSNTQQSRLAAFSSSGSSQPSSPVRMGIDGSPRLRQAVQGSPHRGSGLRPLPSSEQDQLHLERLQSLQQRPLLQHSQSASTRPSHTGARHLQNPQRPVLSARTSRKEVDAHSSDDMERLREHRRVWKDREGSGRGFGFDFRSDDDERGELSSSQEDQRGLWEMERQRDRAKEHQLFQLLHGSRSQQHQARERAKHHLASTSAESLVGGDVAAPVPTSSSAPVSYAHSPVSTFARTSSASSASSSSSPSLGFQHLHPYEHEKSHPVLSKRTSSAASTASIYDNLDNLSGGNDFAMGMFETMLARRRQLGAEGGFRSEVEGGGRIGASSTVSAATSTRSLPLGFTSSSSASAATRLAVRNWIEEQDEGIDDPPVPEGKSGSPFAARSMRSSSRTGSTSSTSDSMRSLSISASHSSGSGAESMQAPTSSRRTRPSVAPEAAGSDADISEADEEDGRDEDDEAGDRTGMCSPRQSGDTISSTSSPAPSQLPRPARPVRMGSRRGAKAAQSKAGEKASGDRQRPGPIELPPPPPVVPISTIPHVAKGSSSTAESFGQMLSEGLFQQHHPFATGEGHDYAQFDYSGVPTVQAGSSGPAEGGEAATRAQVEAGEALREQQMAQQQYRQQQQQWLAMQQQQAQMYAPQQGLPALTPSMPPFNLVSGGPVSHFQARQRQQQQQQAANNRRFGANAPGTLSLPASQFQTHYPGQQPLALQQPLTPPAYLHPLGSPGSPYLLGPHHPLNPYGTQHQQPYHPQAYGQHPLAQSFVEGFSPGHMPPPMISPGHPMIPMMYPMMSPMGPPIGYGPAAMTPGAPLTATGDMPALHNSYIHGAVGAPVQAAGVQSTGSQETKGYFDQVYTTPNPYSYGYAGASAGGEEGGAGGIEKEILKDNSQFGKEERPEQDSQVEENGLGDASAEPRPAFAHSQSVASVAGGKEGAAPPLKHANTAPEPLAGR